MLGIDAAWTAHQPSGVALVQASASGWQCRALAPSYTAFLDLARGIPWDPQLRAQGSEPNPAALLQAGRQLTGVAVVCIAVDIPLATTPITGRRAADNAIASRYGPSGCAVHSPSTDRPGPIADQLYDDCSSLGYRLHTNTGTPQPFPALIEVYPHVTLLALLNRNYRLPYKVSHSSQYWKTEQLSRSERIQRLLQEFEAIKAGLDARIAGIPPFIPEAAAVTTLASLKPVEDMLDSLICSWMGIEHLEGRSNGVGDANAAIWVPTARSAQPTAPEA